MADHSDFPQAALTQLLRGEQGAIREHVFTLLCGFERVDDHLDTPRYREQVLAWCRQIADADLSRLALPAEYGGQNDWAAAFAAFETLAYFDLSLLVKFGVQFGLFGGSVYLLGGEHQHRQYLADIASLELPGCFAMTETGHGSNVSAIATSARFDQTTQEFIIHTPTLDARKDYIGNAAQHGRMATVFAQLEIDGVQHGVHAFLVPIRDRAGAPLPGVGIEDCGAKLGLHGVDNGRLWFDQVRVPRTQLLDRFAQVDAEGRYTSPFDNPHKRFFAMLGALVAGRISVALAALSASKTALVIALRYADRRRQFGPPDQPEIVLLDYLSHQRRLLPRLATSYALDFALKHLVARFLQTTEDERQPIEALAAGLKAYGTWHTTATIQTAREACGGQGYLAVNRLAALKADTEVFTTFEGDNTVLLQLLAKSLLSDYKHQFGNMDFLGLVRYLAGQAAILVTELNPLVTRITDPGHLRGREFQQNALRWREQRLLASVARRLKARIDQGMDGFQAIIETQDHLLRTAHAHVERVLLEQFAAAIDACADPAVSAALGPLCDLFALSRIEDDLGWFLEKGYIESGKAKAIRTQVNALCGELRPRAVALADAFGIPDLLLGAPIALA
ncbi:MAG: acyl-CoA dehydrogenase [Gammaproteobacteria bacterium]